MMWLPVRIAAYTSILLAYGLLLTLAMRYRLGRGRVHRLLTVTLFVAIGWTLVLGVLDLVISGNWWAYVWHRVAQIGLVLLALLTAEFADAFVQRRGHPRLRAAIVVAMVVVALALDAVSIYLPSFRLPLLSLSFGPVEAATLLLLAAWLVGSGVTLVVIGRALRRARGYKHRNRVRYLLVSVLPFVVGDMLVGIGGVPDVYVGFAARLLGFCIITFSLLRYDLPDLRRLWLSSLRAGLLVGLTAALYLLAVSAASLVSGAFFVLPNPTVLLPVAALAVLVAAGVDVALRPALIRFFDRSFLGQTYDLQKALRTYSQQVALILDLERLADTTLQWLADTMRVEHSAFMLLLPQGRSGVEVRVVRSTGQDPPPPAIFGADSRFLAHFRNIRQPLSQYDLDMLTWFQTMPAAEREWLRGLGVDLYVPAFSAEGPVALLGLGSKGGGRPYSEEDLEALMLLTGQTAAALENARLVTDLRGVQGDLQRLNEELSETNRQFQRLDQTKTDFVTIASHELRTPLSQIFGYSDVLSSLKADELGDSQIMQEFLAGISRGARRLKQVVDAMVDMSLIETGAMRIQRLPIPMSVVLSNAVSTVSERAERRQQSIVVESLSDLPYVAADGARLEQVFVSLLSNAIKFTPDGGRIQVSGRAEGAVPEAGYVQICVADEGIGVDPDHQALIFEKFYRSENLMQHSTDDVGFKGAGPGLGLSIARGIVEAHGGRIWVESAGRDEAGCPGSQFYVRLPLVAGKGAEFEEWAGD
ncbi:MAG: HAMP domain-containing sensor histidine kinase [Anaerolineae bacterium]